MAKTKILNNILHNDNLVFSFLRSAVSSQTSSWVDLFTSFAMKAWVGLTPFVSTAIGATLGGVVNCIICYKFTFHADGCSWRAVAVKYILVWLGSLLLNAFGTQIVDTWLSSTDMLESARYAGNMYFMIARVGVSLIVSWFWNFLLQRHFVYRPTRFDPYAIAFTEALGFKSKSCKVDKDS